MSRALSFVSTVNLEKKALNQITPREAMGLPDYVVPSALETVPSARAYRKLLKLRPRQLVSLLESPTEALKTRWLAGEILNTLGDPRFVNCAPHMKNIPGGRVVLGLDEAKLEATVESLKHLGVIKSWIAKECPRYSIDVKSFRLSKYLVTNEEYFRFLDDTRLQDPPSTWHLGFFPRHQRYHPVAGVTLRDAELYCEWLSQKLGRHFYIPSEPEWEYAAAGPERREFPWGNEFLKDHCNSLESRLFSTSPVGMFSQGNSVFGISDMAGNIEELTSSLYGPYPGGELISDDLYEKFGPYPIARGGSYLRFFDLLRNKRRHGGYPSPLYPLGFRVAERV